MTQMIPPARLCLALMMLAFAGTAHAAPRLSQEPPEGELRAGQKVLVDDGTCPAGQIKEVTGGNTLNKARTQIVITRARRCVPRGR